MTIIIQEMMHKNMEDYVDDTLENSKKKKHSLVRPKFDTRPME